MQSVSHREGGGREREIKCRRRREATGGKEKEKGGENS